MILRLTLLRTTRLLRSGLACCGICPCAGGMFGFGGPCTWGGCGLWEPGPFCADIVCPSAMGEIPLT